MKVVLLCGSGRFQTEMAVAARDEAAAGNIVITYGKDAGTVWIEQGEVTTAMKSRLALLWQQLTDIADEILVINPDGYMGESTQTEIAYAKEHNTAIRFTHKAP